MHKEPIEIVWMCLSMARVLGSGHPELVQLRELLHNKRPLTDEELVKSHHAQQEVVVYGDPMLPMAAGYRAAWHMTQWWHGDETQWAVYYARIALAALREQHPEEENAQLLDAVGYHRVCAARKHLAVRTPA